MDHKKNLQHQERVLKALHMLPRKMLSLHERDNVTEFVLSELCGKNCFNLQKAAFFVNNPDFNCCKGIAGYVAERDFKKTSWEHPEDFSKHMQCCEFNAKVRNQDASSFIKEHSSEQELANVLAKNLGFVNPSYCSWDMKNANHGLLIFEKPEEPIEKDETFVNGLCLLGFCPIF